MINLVALAIQKYVTVYEMVSFQMGTHPLLTSAPTKYALVKACEDAIAKIRHRTQAESRWEPWMGMQGIA